ncbi:histidine phosphatase family protein [Anaerocolumna sp. AGMB13020]|uniref:histidine phosphatase family protein n=1 Tax=Anaerocolumna sp. AGMB13020 TaxID=3081750 RepID=UPI0029533CA4|nr:histidine phosphatase family protein [Anaerocolumna sp. AGMB13020]WOO38614.1 histidine phosphatase family protein [Anaerocolumna sp. AGMB13020]
MGRSIRFIRHGITAGNLEKRYVGSTDEGLCETGKQLISEKSYLYPFSEREIIYASPLRRCKETAEILFPAIRPILHKGLRECNFGEFEYKNYLELADNAKYQAWIDSGGTMDFPGGEGNEAFKERCTKAYEEILLNTDSPITFVVHGGTIMAILNKYSLEKKGYFDWQLKNGEGYLCELVGEYSLKVLQKLS